LQKSVDDLTSSVLRIAPFC